MGAIVEQEMQYIKGMVDMGKLIFRRSKNFFPVTDFHRLAWWIIWRRYPFLMMDDEIDHRPDLRQIIELTAWKQPPETDLKAFQRELERALYRFARDFGWIKGDHGRWERLEELRGDLFWECQETG